MEEADDPELKQVMQDSLNHANALLRDRQAKIQDFIRQTGQGRNYFQEKVRTVSVNKPPVQGNNNKIHFEYIDNSENNGIININQSEYYPTLIADVKHGKPMTFGQLPPLSLTSFAKKWGLVTIR
ncbi:MAG: hypothetical protein K2O29_09550 [Ruminococcus sp.]|nr:hypothetical protein [Ruminococcus sp.]